MNINLNWAQFKEQLNKSLPYRYIDIQNIYHIYALDGVFQFECQIPKTGNDDQTDFETNYKNNSFSTFSQFDADGAQIVRIKAAKRGWSFWALPIEITTSTVGGSLYIKDSNGNNISWITCKIYDDSNVEITDAGLVGNCVKTVIDFEPTFDFEIIGGSLCINNNPSEDIRLWIVGAPDIPAHLGGSKEFASGVNLKFLSADNPLLIDGRVTKFLQYNATTHQGKMRILLKHPAGTQVNMLVTIQIYRL